MFFFPNSKLRTYSNRRMVNLLRKIFIKNCNDTGQEKVRIAHGKLGAAFGIITNSLLVGLKLSAALLLASRSNWVFSMALLGDTINNLGDIASSAVALIGFSLASKPADKEHPYGHERIEYIAALIVSMLILAAALELLFSSIKAIVGGANASYDLYSLIVLGIAVALKLMQAYVNQKLGSIISSVTLKATAIDSLTDAIATSVILVCAILSYTLGWGFLDPYVGIAVSLFIGCSGIKMIKEASDPLIGQPASKDFEMAIIDEVKKHAEVLGVHDVLCHEYGPTKRFVSLHAEVDSRNDLTAIHDVIDQIEEDVRQKFSCEITIHLDPIQVGDKETEELKKRVADSLSSLDPKLTIHDFRAIKEDAHVNVLFDCLIPYDSQKLTEAQIFAHIRKTFQGENYNFIVHFDRPYDE